MNLVQCYAQVVKEVDTKKVLAYMRARGHLSLLPKVLKHLAREPEKSDLVVVAHSADVAKMKKKFPDTRIDVDEKLVGGYIARRGTVVTDASYRHALVTLYQNTIT